MDEEFLLPYCRGPKVRRGGRRVGRTFEGKMGAGGEGRRGGGSEGVRRSRRGAGLVV